MTGDIVERMKAVLRPIAKEADDWETYILGNNCYGPDCPPDLKKDYPARVPFKLLSDARAVLAEVEKLGKLVLYPAMPATDESPGRGAYLAPAAHDGWRAETRADEIARLKCEIGERYSRLQYLAMGSNSVRASFPPSPSSGSET